ncbi:MAG: transglutaminase domain-containing protein [Lachnospiraceae bacterium]
MKKIVTFLLSVVILITSGSRINVLAAPMEEMEEKQVVPNTDIITTIDSVVSVTNGEEIFGSIINPIYQDCKTDELIQNTQALENNQSGGDFSEINSAARYIRQQMVFRQPVIVFNYWMDNYESEIGNQIITSALNYGFDASMSTAPNEGDYLRFHFGGGKFSWKTQKINEKYCMTVTMNVSYFSSVEQEESVNAKVQEILKSLNLVGQDDYTKARLIYDYVTSNVSYDYATLNDNTVGKYTAYNALIRGTAVCQGYSNVMYRLLRESGIDCRIVTSTNHAWNILKQGNYYYYNIDSTWDAGSKGQYKYFMKNMSEFEDKPEHYREEEYLTQEFTTSYPMASRSIAAGECGDVPLTGGTWEQRENNWNYILNGVKQTKKWIRGKETDLELRYVDESGKMVTNNYAFDGLHTYYMMANGMPMKNRISWDPEGVGLIYFDQYGYMQFNAFRQTNDGYIYYFGADGRALRNEITFWNNHPYYLDGTGKMQQNGWFLFANGRDYGYANGDGTLMNTGFTYDPWGRVVYFHWNGMVARGLITDGTWYYLMNQTDGHLMGQFQ